MRVKKQSPDRGILPPENDILTRVEWDRLLASSLTAAHLLWVRELLDKGLEERLRFFRSGSLGLGFLLNDQA